MAIVAALMLLASLLPGAVVAAGPSAEVAAKLRHPHVPDRVIVTYESSASATNKAASVRSVQRKSVRKISPLASDTVVVELQPGQSVADALEQIGSQPGVAAVQPDYLLQIAATSDDPYYTGGSLWGMYGNGTSPSNGFGSGAGEAWAQGFTGSSDVYVGIVDQGIQYDHPDLAANMWVNPGEIPGNGVDDDGNDYIDDVYGFDFANDDGSVYDSVSTDWHGTHVAGTVGAVGGNDRGVAGVNWNVKLISAKFLDGQFGSTSNAVEALDYLTDLKLDRGLNIVASNNSWSGTVEDTVLVAAIERGGDAGILFVAAAGNNGTDISAGGNRVYPAASDCDMAGGWDCIISVANLDDDGSLNSGSNYSSTKVDLGAPGTNVWSTYPEDTYGLSTGTSMATPHVAGAIALCASIDPSLTAEQIRGHLVDSVTDTSSLAGTTATGGRLDIPALIGRCGATVSVPNLYELGASGADSAIATAGLVKGTVGTAYSNTVARDLVTSQVPTSGSTADMGSTVSYTLSLGKPKVPAITGKTVAQATGLLTPLTLSLGAETLAYDNLVAKDLIISQGTAPDTEVDTGSAVSYTLSLGKPKVPDITGKTVAQATTALAGVSLVLGTPTLVHSDEVAAGTVISQAIDPGSTVDVGTAVDYVLSDGPITVPDILGMTELAADAAIAAAGLSRGEVTSTYVDDDATRDLVISQDPASGIGLGPNDPVDYILSLGQPRVPDITNLAQSLADDALADVTLVPGITSSAFHATVPLGSVISQSIDPGTIVTIGSVVHYVVSDGPTTAPDIGGFTSTAADAAIIAADLVVGAVTTAYDDDDATEGLVIGQDPVPGTDLGTGDPVGYEVSLGRPLVPDITSMTVAAAEAELAAATLVPGAVTSEHHAAIPAGHVIGSVPAAGTEVAIGAIVAYTVSLGGVPAPITTVTPDAAVIPSTVIVDDKSSRFIRKGTGWGARKNGYAARSLWAPARKSSVKRFALWKPELDAAGRYRIQVKVPGYASTKRAAYQIRTTGGWVKRVRNQLKNRGRWVDLGVHSLAARPVVRLTDKTGEAGRSGRRIVFDAMRFVPVGPFPSAASVTPAAEPPPTPTSTSEPVLVESWTTGSTETPAPDPELATPTPIEQPTSEGTVTEPTAEPEPIPTAAPTPEPTLEPIAEPTSEAAAEPTPAPTTQQEPAATPAPTPEPMAEPSPEPTPEPTTATTLGPEPTATPAPTPAPTPLPTTPAVLAAATTPEPTPQPTPEPEQTPEPVATVTAQADPRTDVEPQTRPERAPDPAPAATPKPNAIVPPQPARAPDRPPTQSVMRGSIVRVDDLDSGFKRSGDAWQHGPAGLASSHWWVPVRNNLEVHSATWRPQLPVAGMYAVQVYVPGPHATSQQAAYKIRTADGWVTRVRDQSKHRGGWVTLGVHRLSRTPIVQLTDQTGEDPASGRTLAFDAVRFVPTAATETKIKAAGRD